MKIFLHLFLISFIGVHSSSCSDSSSNKQSSHLDSIASVSQQKIDRLVEKGDSVEHANITRKNSE